MRLAACYTVFNGLELLENAIKQIREEVDEIIICWQKTSNTGNISADVEAFIKKFEGLHNYHIVFFEPKPGVFTKENEQAKHQLMIDKAKELDCTHFLLSATDHFYKKDEFSAAKKEVLSLDFDVTFTKMYTYYKLPTWQLTPIEDYFMPFICKLYPDTRIDRAKTFPYNEIRVDQSVQVRPCGNWNIFQEDEIMLHHFSMIRDDVKNKFSNAAASVRWKPEMIKDFQEEFENYDINKNPGVKYFQGRKIKVVEDYFLGSTNET